MATRAINRRRCLFVLGLACATAPAWLGSGASCGAVDAEPRPVPEPTPHPAPVSPAVFAAYATPLAEPWNAVLHDALTAAERAGRIRYVWKDGLDTVEKQMGAIEHAIAERTTLVVADAAEGADEILALARQHPGTAFMISGPDAPQEPNVSTFDSTLAEPAYLCGLAAGRLTKSNVVGIVAGRHDQAVHRTLDGFIQGVREANPAATIRTTFIDAWFDPPKARKAGLDLIAAGADVVFAEREGAIAAARETGARAFGALLDQHQEGPDTVVGSAVWNMQPALDHVLGRLTAGTVPAEQLGRFNSLARGGATLAPWRGWEHKLPPEVLQLVAEKRAALVAGTILLRVSSEPPRAE